MISAATAMTFTRAIARRPNKDLADGITSATLGTPSYRRTMAQFDAYVAALESCGLAVTLLKPLEGHPDAHFVEDAAVVMPEMAVITRPGASARQGEVASIADALASHRPIARIEPPGTLDGGDVLIVGRQVWIGLSQRTNPAGAEQLGEILSPFGYTWASIPVAAGLHFKSSVNAVGPNHVLTTAAFADHPVLANCDRLVVSDREAYAANTLLVNGRLLMPAGFADTRKTLQTLDTPIIELEMSEFQKMDGGLTCLSLRF